MKPAKKAFLTAASLVAFILLFEIALRMTEFNYYSPDEGFNITPKYRIFEVSDNNYQTKGEKIGIFQNQTFPVKKDKNETRIFILGGSSVYNLENFLYLSDKLNKSFPKQSIRIINIGGNSYGSTRLLLHLNEIIEYQPDVILLYSGHNEFEEKYINDRFFKDNIFTKMNDWLFSVSRLYQLMSKIINSLQHAKMVSFPPKINVTWGITFDKEAVYQNYERNIAEMIDIARKNNKKIIVSTVAYNRMVPPFKPKDDSYEACFLNTSEYENECLSDALDSDLQPHRATKTSNQIVKKVAERYDVSLIDFDNIIINASQNNVVGHDLFADHSHLNPSGNRILQEEFYKAIMRLQK